MEAATLSDLFLLCSGSYAALIEDDSQPLTDAALTDALATTELTIERVREQAMFSVGESIDEHPTVSIKYLFLDYYCAKLHASWLSISERLGHLTLAKRLFEYFIQRCVSLGALSPEDTEDISRDEDARQKPRTADEVRMAKIARFKRDRDAKAKIKTLRSSLAALVQRGPEESGAEVDREDELREMLLLQLQSYVRDSVENISSINQEMQLLRHMKNIEETHKSGGGARSSSGSSSGSREDFPGGPQRPSEEIPRGISVTRLSKTADGRILSSREQVISSVFQPRMAAPSMTLEEFGDLQREEAIAREAVERNAPISERNYRQLLADGEEDDAELMDRATEKDRAWDNWKESSSANWRGAGNKAGKRF